MANHLTYLDMLALCHETGCLFVSREDVQHWPVLGVVARSLRIIFVDRASRRDTGKVDLAAMVEAEPAISSPVRAACVRRPSRLFRTVAAMTETLDGLQIGRAHV